MPQALDHLNPQGCIYILLISDNMPFLPFLDTFAVTWEVLLKREVTGEK